MAVQDAEFEKTDTPFARDKALKLERAKKCPPLSYHCLICQCLPLANTMVANWQRSLDNVLIGIRHRDTEKSRDGIDIRRKTAWRVIRT